MRKTIGLVWVTGLLVISHAWAGEALKPVSPRVLVNRIGWPADAPKTVVADHGGAFRVLDREGKAILTGTFAAASSDIAGGWHTADLTNLSRDGYYQVQTDKGASAWFAVGEPALAAYRELATGIVAGFKKQRAGLRGDAEGRHSDDGRRYDNGERQDYSGGWFDADDTRKFSLTTAVGIDALAGAAERGLAADAALTEARWGAEFLLKLQEPDGFFIYGLEEGYRKKPTTWSMERTDRVYMTEPHSLMGQWRCVAGLARAARMLKRQDADFAARCLASARKAHPWSRARSQGPQAADDPVRRWRALTSDMRCDGLDIIEAELHAAVELYKTTGERDFLEQALAAAAKRGALQVTTPVGGVSGFFWMDAERKAYHVPKIGAFLPLIDLDTLIETAPDHAQRPAWEKQAAAHLDGTLLPLASRNAFAHAPFGVFVGTTKIPGRQLADGIYYRIFKGNPEFNFTSGRSAVILGYASGAAVQARRTGRTECWKFAWRQLDWVLGANPDGFCARIINAPRKGEKNHPGMSIPAAVGVPNGVLGDEADQPRVSRTWPSTEQWLPNSANLLTAILELVYPTQSLPAGGEGKRP
jgi:hypothetical protein